MNFAIDPDVFIAAFDHFNCSAALTLIASQVAAHRFIRDREAILEKEYRHIFSNRFSQDTAEHPAIRLLQQILFEDGDSKDELSALHSLVEGFKELGCREPVEPVLLGMMANGRQLGLALMMVGTNLPGIRIRGIHDEKIRWEIRKQIPWLNVFTATNTQVTLSQLDYEDDNPPHIKAKQDAFEAKAALYLQDQNPDLRCITPPPQGKMGGEQVDVYGYRTTESGTIVVVGECKLRREGNEEKLINSTELQQLYRKVIAARDYETNNRRRKSIKQAELSFEGIFITNADGLDETAKALLRSGLDFRVRVMRVVLSKNWEATDKWGIVRSMWLDFC